MQRISPFLGALCVLLLTGSAQAQSPTVQEQKPSVEELMHRNFVYSYAWQAYPSYALLDLSHIAK